ncbi:chromate transporter [Bacillus testis]|uniref:chromate transporter n=1 Tax=Bacillus testis TaxID=1622072 RepID=UPI00067F164B|nr:chromate transporter [Bacillus testis]
MIYWQMFLAFFIPGMLGYGGGPANIPLVKEQVVDTYGWMSVSEFSEMIAVGNALPGPIATKMAGYVGYEVAGAGGAAVALFATVAPSLIMMVLLLAVIMKHKDSPKVKRLTNFIRPIIAVLLGVMALRFFIEGYETVALAQTIIIAVAAFLLMEKFKIHPAYVIAASLLYGALFLG